MILLTGTQYDTSLHVVLLETGYEISDELIVVVVVHLQQLLVEDYAEQWTCYVRILVLVMIDFHC